MKRIIVTREKKFAGVWVPFWIIPAQIVEMYPTHFQTVDEVQLDAAGYPRPTLTVQSLNEAGRCIRSGETVTIECDDAVTGIYAVTMDGILSNRLPLRSGEQDGDAVTYRFRVKAKGGFARPAYPWFIPEDE